VQSFVDLCSRHEDKFYKFVHEVHIHDKDLLFTHLMNWVDIILSFLRNGLTSHMDMNALVFHTPGINVPLVLAEIASLVEWNKDRKVWNERRLRAKFARAGEPTIPQGGFSPGDFGLDEDEILQLQADCDYESPDSEMDDHDDPDDFIALERKRRVKRMMDETSRKNEPVKPRVTELLKLVPVFVDGLREDLGRRVICAEELLVEKS
jgi:Domain of unknown function in PX-proteins (DUF3818)